jgi:putative endonuclease
VGRRGEEAAYFHRRKLRYIMAARNFRWPRCREEIDLRWDKDVLRFVEVKSRSTLDGKPGEAAVGRHKRRDVAAVVRECWRRSPPSCQWRFDVVSVYYGHSKASQPQKCFGIPPCRLRMKNSWNRGWKRLHIENDSMQKRTGACLS